MSAYKNHVRGPKYPTSSPMIPNRYNCPSLPFYHESSLATALFGPIYDHPKFQQLETSYIYIPNSGVSAVIGTRGSQIRLMMKKSGARIIIPPIEKKGNSPTSKRKVTIVGPPSAHISAQFLIFNRLIRNGFVTGIDAPLMVEISIPSKKVGSIIGKGGQTVQFLQRETGAVVKIPKQSETNNSEETPIHIIGACFSVLAAQHEIHLILNPLLRRLYDRKLGWVQDQWYGPNL